ncbi:MAG: ribose-5-phosphate isomerase RpiA [Verrucomicrobia bacterium]|nr:ribose-5-phosphate isomerase RpiA [Verrucomicrobiota bacterium]MDE3047797.1 ribose-5-phosphate isomerase RpiA [Verrucomicrobiota bacterium]
MEAMIDDAKMAAGRKAVQFIKNGMIVGLGSGSTAECFIQALIDSDRKIQAVASSRASADLAKRGGIEVLDINTVPRIDITVDGADEIDPQNRMIKGGGGAHVREKILASASDELIIVVDNTKLVPSIGTRKLPIEVMFYGSPATRMKIERTGHQGQWRLNPDGTLFITENGNLLFDMHFSSPPKAPEHIHDALLHIPGVVDTGFFFNMAKRVIIGYPNGKTEIR